MLKGKKIACIIPARLKSKRFPEKILKKIGNKSILQWIWENSNKMNIFDYIVFAIDSEKTAKHIKNFGGKYIMTSENCNSGTERIIEIFKKDKINADIWLNWQGDNPFVNKQTILDLFVNIGETDIDIWTLKKEIYDKNKLKSPNTVKVVTDKNDFALYFSRSEIPYNRDNIEIDYYKHVGLYAYTSDALKKISSFKNCSIEESEKLEQLRFLYNNLNIKVELTEQETIGINTPEDLKEARIIYENNRDKFD